MEAKFRFDRAENEPAKSLQMLQKKVTLIWGPELVRHLRCGGERSPASAGGAEADPACEGPRESRGVGAVG